MKTPADRACMIDRSLRCYACGWCSFIPIVGLPMFVLALLSFQKARVLGAGEWNPARRYLNWGMLLATLGGFISAVLFAVIVFRIVTLID